MAAAVACCAALPLAGCGSGDTGAGSGGSSSPSVSSTRSADAASPSTPASSPSASADASTSALPEDWRPEEPKVLATGQKVPDDYEPATLDHPARNVPKPVMPAEASEETEAGAQAFLNYRADAQWYSIQTGDTSLIRAVTSTDCAKCSEQYDAYDSMYSNGKWAAGGFEKQDLEPGSFAKRPDGGYNLPVEVRSSGSLIFDKRSIPRRQLPFDEPHRFDTYLYRDAGRWTYLTGSPRGSL